MTLSSKRLILSVGIVMLLGTGSAQRRAAQSHKNWYQQALRLYNLDEPDAKTDSIAYRLFMKTVEATRVLEKELASNCLIKAGNIRQGQSKFTQANEHYHDALALVNQFQLNSQLRFEALLYLGSSHYFSNIIDSAQFYFEEASAVADAYKGKNALPELDRLYNSLGAIYFESANYNQAKNYFERALDLSAPTSDDYADMYTGIQSNIASCLMKLNQYRNALHILLALKPAEHQQNLILQNTAHCYFRLGQSDSALTLYKKHSPAENYSGVIAITDIGRIYMQKGEWEKAEAAFDSAIQRNNRISPGIKNKEGANAYLYRSQMAGMRGLNEEAMSWINAALEASVLSDSTVKGNILQADLSLSVSPVTLFSILQAKAGLLLKKYMSRNDQSALLDAVATYKRAIETADYIKKNFDNDEARLFFTENNKSIYTEALEASFQATAFNEETINDVLFILENYKGKVLQQQWERNQVREKTRAGDSAFKKEQSLKQLIAFYLSRINQTTAITEVQSLLKKKRAVEIELSRLQTKNGKAAYSQSLPVAETKNTTPIKQVQKKLTDNTTVINFYEANDSTLFCLQVNKELSSIHKIQLNNLYHQNLSLLISQLYGQQEGKRYQGHQAAMHIYNTLFKTTKLDDDKNEHWVLIPDGKLYLVPFEALETSEEIKHYLIRTKNISYHFSMALLLKTESVAPGAVKGKILGLTPFDQADDAILKSGFAVLPESGAEIDSSQALRIAGPQASKTRFLDEYSKFQTLHLATHAGADTSSNMHWIQFYPSEKNSLNNRIFLPEIYQLDLKNTNLVILSACESGKGQTAAGEGVISLSRGFLYAGSRGVISTCWKSEDKVSAYLMKKLHQQIREGVPVATALQKAKLDLLADQSLDERFKHPSYWANFIYFGEVQSSVGTTNFSYLTGWLILGALILLIGLYLSSPFKRFKRNRSQELIRS